MDRLPDEYLYRPHGIKLTRRKIGSYDLCPFDQRMGFFAGYCKRCDAPLFIPREEWECLIRESEKFSRSKVRRLVIGWKYI